MSSPYELFAVTAPGLERVCAAELSQLGITGESTSGGVSWRGDRASLYRSNLELRTASRVIARAGEFRARGFPELERRAARLSWRGFLAPGTTVTLRVTSRKSKLYHERAVADRLARVLEAEAGAQVQEARNGAEDEDGISGQLIIVRLFRDVCTISVDSSGALLHLRGYRQAVAKAPLRETIAAAMLLASGWRGDTPLIDPFCGSGTIPIEAALLARRIAPGIANAELRPRGFRFEHWPDFDRDTYERILSDARRRIRDDAPRIIGADRNAGAIAAAQSNAARAGVSGDIELQRAALDDLTPPDDADTGHLVTNPPYGVRIGERPELLALYAKLGEVAATRLPGWKATILSADDALARATGVPFRELLATRNGGIPVSLLSTAHSDAPAV